MGEIRHGRSGTFPRSMLARPLLGGFLDVFVTKFTNSGVLAYSTYLVGSDDELESVGIAVDASSEAYVTGSTTSVDFPTRNASQPCSPRLQRCIRD